jgi:predicted lipoprotein with Yx(FWY)xxD motif
MKGTLKMLTAAAPVALALIASGCGGDAQGATAYGGATTPGATKSAAGAATVKAANSKLGHIIVDSKGRTLYVFEKDRNHRSACYGPCATYWPPLLTHGTPKVAAGAKHSLVGWVRRTNGSQQVTYAGHPLYRYVGDTRAGQTTGEGLTDFGAGWDAITPAGKKIEADSE